MARKQKHYIFFSRKTQRFTKKNSAKKSRVHLGVEYRHRFWQRSIRIVSDISGDRFDPLQYTLMWAARQKE